MVLSSWCVVLIAAGLLGCDDRDSIRRYQVPHERSVVTSTRTLAAIVPRQQQAWFFKAMGANGRIGAISDDFIRLVKSVKFEGGNPTWALPEGWTQTDGDQFRFATLRSGDTEISVSALPLPAGDDFDGYVLANVNRWREQLAQMPLKPEQLHEITQRVPLADGSAVIFDSGQGGDEQPSGSDESTPSSRSAGLTYEVPEGWKVSSPRPMRLATFTVDRDGLRLEVALSRLGPQAGSLLANVNRWRGQIGLDETDAAQLEEDRKLIGVDGADCDYVQMMGPDSNDPQQAIFVVVVKRPDQTLFIKLSGDRELAEEEQSNFEKLVASIRFPSQ